MENLRKIKMLINRLNKRCKDLNQNILAVLNYWNIDIIEFFSMIGVNLETITAEIANIINELFQNPHTTILYNPSMTDLNHEEIEFFAPDTNIYLGCLTSEIKAHIENNEEQNEFFYHDFKYYACRIKEGKKEKISFYLNTCSSSSDLKFKIITNKYFLKHMTIGIIYELNGEKQELQITINEDMLERDLDHILNLLYSYNFKKAKDILMKYPADLKFLSNEVDLHNFNIR